MEIAKVDGSNKELVQQMEKVGQRLMGPPEGPKRRIGF